MVANLTAVRTDLPYLRRRVRPGTQPAQAAEPPARVSLRLTGPNEVIKPKYAVPTLDVDVTLTKANPVTQLNRRQSAIGSLLIQGAVDFAWEAAGVGGSELVGGQEQETDSAAVYAGRPLVQQRKGDVVLNLRHSAALRRLLVRARQPIVVTLYSGRKITVAAGENGAQLLISRLDGVLELRREETHSAFGFAHLTADIPQALPSRAQLASAGNGRTLTSMGVVYGQPAAAYVSAGFGQEIDSTGEEPVVREVGSWRRAERRLAPRRAQTPEARAILRTTFDFDESWREDLIEALDSGRSSADIYRQFKARFEPAGASRALHNYDDNYDDGYDPF